MLIIYTVRLTYTVIHPPLKYLTKTLVYKLEFPLIFSIISSTCDAKHIHHHYNLIYLYSLHVSVKPH